MNEFRGGDVVVTPEAGITLDPLFIELPTKRAAYSDRTSVLMADLARMAYIKFERPDEPELDDGLSSLGPDRRRQDEGKQSCEEA